MAVADPVTAIMITMAGIGAVAQGVAAFSKPKTPTALSAAQTQTQQAEAAQAAAQAQATALSRRRGMAATTLTSPLGVTGGTQTQRTTLGA